MHETCETIRPQNTNSNQLSIVLWKSVTQPSKNLINQRHGSLIFKLAIMQPYRALQARVHCIKWVWSTAQLFSEPWSSTKQGKRIQIAGVLRVVKPTDLNVWSAGSEVLKKSYTPRMDNMSSSEGHFLNKCLMQSIIPAVLHPGLTSDPTPQLCLNTTV